MLNNIKAVIFDVDGTLADTEKDGHRIAFNQTFKQYNLDWHWSPELYGELLKVTGGKERMKFYVNDYLNSDLEDKYIAELHKYKTAIYIKILKQGLKLRLGVEKFINDLRVNNIRLAIATTTQLLNVTALLEHTLGKKSIAWFDVIAAGDMVEHKKPAADVYNYALNKLNLDASECLAIEDSKNGLISALGANIKTVITYNDYTKNEDFTGANLVIENLESFTLDLL
jgi:HAD superfamily hydrolase (TIGR01509 family)